MKRFPGTLIFAVVIFLMLASVAVVTQVRFNEVGVRLYFGKPKAKIEKPGLVFRWPYPIESIEKFDKRLRTLDTLEQETKTLDEKNVIVRCYVLWRISDPVAYLQAAPTEVEVEQLLRTRLTEAQVAAIGNVQMSDFVNLDGDALEKSYARLEGAMLAELTASDSEAAAVDGTAATAPSGGVVMKDFGARIEAFRIARVTLPAEATQEVFKTMIAERGKRVKEYQTQGQSYALQITSRAETDRQSILAFARRRADETRAEGTRAATKILAELSQENEELFIWLRQLEAAAAALAQKTTFFLDSDSELLKVLMSPASFKPEGTSAATSQPAADE